MAMREYFIHDSRVHHCTVACQDLHPVEQIMVIHHGVEEDKSK